MIRSLVDWPGEVPVRASVWVVRDDWKSVQQQWALQQVKHSPFGPNRTLEGHFDLDGKTLALHQQIEPEQLNYTLRASADTQFTGLYWVGEFPTETFAGGEMWIGDARVLLPAEKADDGWAHTAAGRSFRLVAKGGASVGIELSTEHEIRVQDARRWNEPRYQVLVKLRDGVIKAASPISFSVKISTKVPTVSTDATVTVDAKEVLSEFDGFGGNFVYATQSPVTALALESFKLTWARIGIEAARWEPTNDNDDPKLTDYKSLASRDVPGSPLRERFELDQRLFKLAEGRLIASVWYPPEFLFVEPLPFRDRTGTIPRERWNELAECVTSYLVHLKTQYGVEPALFSFNEPDIGIYVLLGGEELRDLTRLLGERFESAGLRTKILLGDSADLKLGLEQIRPTLDDAQTMKHVGALAYHPWSGQNEWWDDWVAVAEKHGLMLMATEMGADPQAWKDGSVNSPLATVRLAHKYIEQLRDARTQVLLEWEWTGDYPVAEPDASGKLVLTPRGRFLEQLTQTTPTQASVVKAVSDADTLLAAAVLADDRRSAAIHLLNRSGERTVIVKGLPEGLSLATLFIVDPTGGPSRPQHVEAKAGECHFVVPAGAIATLAFPQIR